MRDSWSIGSDNLSMSMTSLMRFIFSARLVQKWSKDVSENMSDLGIKSQSKITKTMSLVARLGKYPIYRSKFEMSNSLKIVLKSDKSAGTKSNRSLIYYACAIARARVRMYHARVCVRAYVCIRAYAHACA